MMRVELFSYRFLTSNNDKIRNDDQWNGFP